jgi:hypothetical protein
MLVQMVLFPPLTHELQILWLHVIMKNEIYNMKNVTYDRQKSDTCNYKKLKACTCNLEKPYDESCNHESYYHESLETYTNKFVSMKRAKSIP